MTELWKLAASRLKTKQAFGARNLRAQAESYNTVAKGPNISGLEGPTTRGRHLPLLLPAYCHRS